MPTADRSGGALAGGSIRGPGRRLSGAELARQSIHIGAGGLAFTVPLLGPAASVAMALSALLFNALVWPRLGGRALWRPLERQQGFAPGIVLYPVTVSLLLLAFWRRQEVAAAVWALFAFGDGAATVAGRALPSGCLPWNREKSWAGSLAYLLCGGLAAAACLAWFGRWSGTALPWPVLLGVAFTAAGLAAWLESQPQGLDDNLAVPLVTSLWLLGLLQAASHGVDAELAGLLDRLAAGSFVCSSLAMLAWLARAVSLSGAVAGFMLSTALFAFGGWRAFVLFVTFFAIGSGVSRLGYVRKALRGVAQERRGARHAVANLLAPVSAAAFAAMTPHAAVYTLAFAGALAAAAADTTSTEIGILWGRRAFSLSRWRSVAPGTPGAMSWPGTLAGGVAAAVLAGVAWGLGLIAVQSTVAVAAAGWSAALLESAVGGALEERGLVEHQALNFLNTLAGALLAVALAALLAVWCR